MNHKVLLADDSLTIQKVIKITLANQPYEITEASSEEELFQKLASLQPKIVFLDFNLSEKFTGYELTTKIKTISPASKVLLLLGTFDTVDDASMEKSGASEKIVKPFDSNKFIAICRQLADSFDQGESIPYPSEVEEKEDLVVGPSEEEQWTVSHTTEQSFKVPASEPEKTSSIVENPLLREVSDWGMSVPGIINDASEGAIELPPVIADLPTVKPLEEGKLASVTSISSHKDEVKYPENDDLDYPTVEELNNASADKAEVPRSTSKLISIDSFKDQHHEIELDISDTTQIDVQTSDDIQSIQDQIRDEIEQDLWQADEFENIKDEVSAKIEEVKSNFQPSLSDFDESLFKPIDDSQSVSWNDAADFNTKSEPSTAVASEHAPAMNMDELRVEIEEMVKKYVKEYLDQMFQKNTEKIAWEVIPDLAENLIRQELSKISSKVLND